MITPHCAHYMWGYRRFKHIPNLGNPYRADPAVLADFVQHNQAKRDTNVKVKPQ
jgi:KDO2-lipid IV(A) lauroyltransferase